MLKWIFCVFACYMINSVTFAGVCPDATAVNAPDFCETFKKAAVCHCGKRGGPPNVCNDMNMLYEQMMVLYRRDIRNACASQKYTSIENCVDNWSCYRTGYDSKGNACNSAAKPCKG